MATVLQLLQSLKEQAKLSVPALAGVDDWDKCIFIDTADVTLLQNTARKGSVVSIFDLQISKNTSRWMTFEMLEQQFKCGITAVVDSKYLNVGLSCTITISLDPSNLTGLPFINDGVAAIVIDGIVGNGACGIAQHNMSLNGLASALAFAINNDNDLNSNISASAAGPIVTLTNISTTHANFLLHTNVSNVGQNLKEVARMRRSIQISTWNPTHQNRDLVGQALLEMVGKLQLGGLTLPDGTWAGINYVGDRLGRDDKLQDLWRWDIILTADMGIDPIQTLFPAQVLKYSKQVGPV